MSKPLIPTHLNRQDEAFEQATNIALDEHNLRSGQIDRTPQVFVELNGEHIQASDTIITVFIRRPLDDKIARVNLILSARHDGNEVTATVQSLGLTREYTGTAQAKFQWIQNPETGDLDYPNRNRKRKSNENDASE